MSSGYSTADLQFNILHSMHETAQTAPLHIVRNVFFSRYITGMSAVACEPRTAMTFDKAAAVFAHNLRKVCPTLAADMTMSNRNSLIEVIKTLLQKEGTPYQKTGYVLEWFKQWRAEQRLTVTTNKKQRWDTNNITLQSELKELLQNVAYSMLGDKKIDNLSSIVREQEPNGLVEPPDTKLAEITSWPIKDPYRLKRTARTEYFDTASKRNETLSKASPTMLLHHLAWADNWTFQDAFKQLPRQAPSLYVLGRYLLNSDKDTWNREFFCEALIREKTFAGVHQIAQSGLDVGVLGKITQAGQVIPPNKKYTSWWQEQVQESARDWRYIRRKSILRAAHNTHIQDATIGDIVARVKLYGPADLVTGVLAEQPPELKALICNRINPQLGDIYLTTHSIEQNLGPMPEVMIDTLQKNWSGPSQEMNAPQMNINNLF